MGEPSRSRPARDLAERALIRLVRAYGEVPEIVLLGGLVPDLLCARSGAPHEGTTDVDLQVDLEIQRGATNAARLEAALGVAGFRPDREHAWRWRDHAPAASVVKIEFLADLGTAPDRTVIAFDGCRSLGAVNLRGTGFAARDWTLLPVTAAIDGEPCTVELRVATLPAYLLAKVHAAAGRCLPKDWYDIAYVLLHNDEGGPHAAGWRVFDRFRADLVGATATALSELAANFAAPGAQGCAAYASTMLRVQPGAGLHPDVLENDAMAAVAAFLGALDLG